MRGKGGCACLQEGNQQNSQQLTAVLFAFIALFLFTGHASASDSYYDDFSGGINPDYWSVTAGAYTIDDTQGDLRISKPAGPGAWAQIFFSHDLYGDFDISVDYRNAVLGGDHNQIQFNILFGGQYAADRRENWSGSRYSVWLDPPQSTVGVTGTADTAGTLRIARTGSIVTFYANGSPIYQGTFNNAPVTDLWLSLQNNGTSDAISVTFDNFSVSADKIDLPCSPAPSGLVAWWGGDNNALDIIGTSNGTLQNGATYADGKVAQAFSLDGTDDYVSGGGSALPLGNSERTLTVWIKTDRIADQSIFHYGIQNGDLPPQNFHLILANASGNAVAGIANGWGYGGAFGTSNLADNQWHFIAGVYEGPGTNIARIYVDGVEEANAVITEPGTGNGSFEIGRFLNDIAGPGAEKFKGLIDEIEIFGRALSPGEVLSMYQAGSGGQCRPCTAPPSGMVAWWRGNNDALDMAGTNDGTLVGGAGYGNGMVGEAFSFNGSGAYVTAPDSPSLDLASDYTLAAWIYATTFNSAGGNPIISKIGGAGGNNGYQLGLVNTASSTTSVWCGFNASGEIWPSNFLNAGSVSVNTWSYIACSYDNDSLRIYINGALAGAQYVGPKSVVDTSSSLRLGTDDNSWTFHSGMIDEAGIYNKALSASNIAAIYNSLSTGICPIDTTPDAFGFVDKANVPLSSSISSDPITVSGIDYETPVSVAGGEYAVSTDSGATWGNWETASGIVNNGDQVKVRQTSSPAYNTTTEMTLTIGRMSDIFSVTTISQHLLTVTTSGTGTGSVSATGCTLDWVGDTGTCTVDYGTHLVLSAIEGSCSFFKEWTDVCLGSGSPCDVTMVQDKTTDAAFDLYPLALVLPPHDGYDTVAAAYTNTSGGEIRLQAHPFGESLSLGRLVDVIFDSGWNCDYTGYAGEASVTDLSVEQGSVTFQGNTFVIGQ
jgi:hypothetical protein